MVFYIDLLSRSYPAFTLSSLTVHRFLITAITVASKGLCDAFCTNTHYAKVGGISVVELNMLELEFLKKVGWKIVPEPSMLDAYYKSMISQDPRYCQEAGPNSSHVDPLKFAETQTLPEPVDEWNPVTPRADISMSD
jgi:Cyclin